MRRSWYLLTDTVLMQDHRKNDQEDQTRLQTMKTISLSYRQQYSSLKCSTYMNNEHWTFMKHNANQRHRNHFQNKQGNQTLCRQACSQSRGIEIDSCHDAWKHRQTLHRIFTEFTERQQLEYNWNVCNTEEKVNSTGRLFKGAKKSAKEFKVIIRILTRLPSTQRTARPSVPVWFKCE